MAERSKYQNPKLIDLSTTDWEVGAGRCETGSAPDVNDPAVDCQSGANASRICNSGGGVP